MNYNKDNGLLNMIRRTDPMIKLSIRRLRCSSRFSSLFTGYTTSLPKGDRASFASRKCILPNGMPMMFPNVFIDLIGVLFVQAY